MTICCFPSGDLPSAAKSAGTFSARVQQDAQIGRKRPKPVIDRREKRVQPDNLLVPCLPLFVSARGIRGPAALARICHTSKALKGAPAAFREY
jgi:hypothetical protein